MKKRLFTKGIALGLAAVMLAGCSGSGTSTSQDSTDAGTTGQSAETQASQGQEQTTIEMWYHISPDQATLLLQMIDEFQELHPGIKVETQSVAFAEIKKQLSIGVAADQLPDVTLCDTVDNVSFAAMGAAMDIMQSPQLSTGRMAQMDDTARATAMGTPAKSITTKSTKIISPQTTAIFILLHPPFYQNPCAACLPRSSD